MAERQTAAGSDVPGPAEVFVVSELFPPAIGGSGELLRNVYSDFDGVPVTVLTDDGAGAGSAATDANMHVIREPMRTPYWGVLHPAGLRHHLRQAVRLRRLCAGRRAVVHCGRALPEGLDAWLAKRMGCGPYLCWVHGEELAYAKSSRELTFLMHRVHSSSAVLIANSRNTAEILETFGAPSGLIEVVYPGVDANRFRPGAPGAADLRAQLVPEGELFLLTVGRLQRRKGHDLVLQALAGLKRDAPPFRYVVAGDGDERARLQTMVSNLGLADRVRFVGAVAAEDLPAYYAAADLFLHPNRVEGDDFEGFGIVFLEAAASGLPVIGGALGGSAEAVARGVTGLLVSGTDVEELQRGILALASAPAMRRQMGAAGRARALRDFSWERAAARVGAIHERVASRWVP